MSSTEGLAAMKNWQTISATVIHSWADPGTMQMDERSVKVVSVDESRLVLDVVGSGGRESFDIESVALAVVQPGTSVLVSVRLRDGSVLALRGNDFAARKS